MIVIFKLTIICFKDFIHLFLKRGEGREKERKRVIDQLPLAQAPTGDQCATQACAPTGNQTGDLSLYGIISNQLSHTD